MQINRREWLVGSFALVASSSIAAAQQHAHLSVLAPALAKLDFLDTASATDVIAIAAQIIPSDDGPGATEAGAVYFIDRALTSLVSDLQPVFRDGLADLNLRREKMFPGSSSFAALDPSQQVELLHSIETTPFFHFMRTGTILAWLGPPQYGGNRNQVGWKYIGFDDAGYFEPPFGYYDAEAK